MKRFAQALAIFLIATNAHLALGYGQKSAQNGPQSSNPSRWDGTGLPSFEQWRSLHQSSELQVLDRRGEWLHTERWNKSERRGAWVPLSEMSAALKHAMVLSEDKRFYEHSGVDWKAVSAAAWGNVFNSKTRGASTLSMQLVGLMNDDLRRPNAGRSSVQKIGQAINALALERTWRKDQVLEAYLNSVPFRAEWVGIDALSRSLFGKAPHALDAREAALAAVLVRAPNANAAAAAQRSCALLLDIDPENAPKYIATKSMNTLGYGPKSAENTAAACQDATSPIALWVAHSLSLRQWPASQGVAAHASRMALRTWQTSPVAQPQIKTTLHAPTQRMAHQLLQRHLLELSGRNVEDGAVVVLDNATGEVLAWVGSSGKLSRAGEVDGVLARRQPGSTLKPFVYALALQQKKLTAASLLDDSPAFIATDNGLYIPQNYDRSFKGWVSLRTALGASLNVPAVRALSSVGVDEQAAQLNALGLQLSQTGQFYGLGLALGAPEVSLLDLTNAYRTLANGGLHAPSQPITGGVAGKPKAVIHEAAAFIITDVLADAQARMLTFGPDSVLNTRAWTAVKTGTSKDMRDNWAIGFSRQYTVGVWVGNASGAPMHNVSGSHGAAPIWAALIAHLHADLHGDSHADLHAAAPNKSAQAQPASVVRQRITLTQDGRTLEPAREELFVKGTEQQEFAVTSTTHSTKGSAQGSTARTTAPTDGTLIAIDPDIPPKAQRVNFQSNAPQAQWWLVPNGKHKAAKPIAPKKLAQGNSASWMPWPGRWKVELRSADGQVLDQIALEVRGAGVR
jgi:penicillin-binding protein 1C